MQSEERANNDRDGVRVIAQPIPQHTDAVPLVQTSTRVPRRRLTTKERRRQRLLELIQQQAKQPASQ